MMKNGKLRGFVIGEELEWSKFADAKKELLDLEHVRIFFVLKFSKSEIPSKSLKNRKHSDSTNG